MPLPWAGFWYLIASPFLVMGVFSVKKRSRENLGFKPLLGLMGAMVFVISCMPVPVPTAGTCSHPAGTGISAILIGPLMSVFVTSIALLIQALFLAHGGITTWGADIVSMGVAGSFAAYAAFKILRKFKASLFISGFAAGLLADWATYITTSVELSSALHGNKPMFSLFCTILTAFIPTQLPLGILEGFLTGGMIVFVYKRRPDILASLGVVKENGKGIIKNPRKSSLAIALSDFRSGIRKSFILSCTRAKIIGILLTSLFLFTNSHLAFAKEATKWNGIDKSVVEKVAKEQGRPAWAPFINTDQGDLLLFVFLLAGTIGGFIMGYNFRKLFCQENRLRR